MTIRGFYPGRQYRVFKPELDEAYRRVMTGGEYILGDETYAFEDEWSKYCGAKWCVGVGNGFDALSMCLIALGIGKGHEVIVPAHTYVATWLAVSRVGAIPVPVIPSRETYNTETSEIERAITIKTKAIIPVHLYGLPCYMDTINTIAAEHGLFIIEDAAQAHGAKYKLDRIGKANLSDAVAWSFYPTKNLGGVGDAGAITTNNPNLREELLALRNYGKVRNNCSTLLGVNSRLDPLQAAFLRVKLKYLDRMNTRRREIAMRYTAELIEEQSWLDLPKTGINCLPAWHQYVNC